MSLAFRPHEDDLQRLVSLLDLTAPKAILELGSGWSTLVVARWLMDHDGTFLEALEADPIYFTSTCVALSLIRDIADRFVGGDNMAKQVRTKEWEPNERYRVLFSTAMNGQYVDGVRFVYQCLTEPDFVYVDGPALWGRRIITENAMTNVVTERPMVFLVDGRVACAARIWAFYKSHLKLPYEWLYCANASCSLVYHEAFGHVGEWFDQTHSCQRAKESESGAVFQS